MESANHTCKFVHNVEVAPPNTPNIIFDARARAQLHKTVQQWRTPADDEDHIQLPAVLSPSLSPNPSPKASSTGLEKFSRVLI